MAGRAWTPEECEALLDIGVSSTELARRLDRSENSVQHKRGRLGIIVRPLVAASCKHPDGCDKKPKGYGWCDMHLRRVRASPTGDPGPVGVLAHAPRECRHPDGCDRRVTTRGWCALHWDRVKKSESGDPGPLESMHTPKPCQHSGGCDRDAYKHGWCGMHWQRVLGSDDNDPGEVESRHAHWRDENGALSLETPICAYGPCEADARFATALYCHKHEQRHRRYLRQYSLGLDDMVARLDALNWLCPIGGEDLRQVKWVVDHDHFGLCGCGYNNGFGGCSRCMRSILCDNCNKMIGQYVDDPIIVRRLIGKAKGYTDQRLEAAVAYLDGWYREMVLRENRPPNLADPVASYVTNLVTEVLGNPKIEIAQH